MCKRKIIGGSGDEVESTARVSHIGSYYDSDVEFQRGLVLLVDLLLAFGSNFSFRLQRKNKHTGTNNGFNNEVYLKVLEEILIHKSDVCLFFLYKRLSLMQFYYMALLTTDAVTKQFY